MQNQNNKIIALLTWLLPSGIEWVIGITFTFVTLAISNSEIFRNLIFLPQDFQLKTAALDSVNTLVETVFGDQIARSGVVAIFWAIVGLGVYVLIWLGINFSNELGNDLAATKYVHPKNVDTHSPLRDLISKLIFQTIALIVLIFHINLIVSTLLPYIGGMFKTTIEKWPTSEALKYAVYGFIAELAVMHGFVVLVRCLTLRKRIFG